MVKACVVKALVYIFDGNFGGEVVSRYCCVIKNFWRVTKDGVFWIQLGVATVDWVYCHVWQRIVEHGSSKPLVVGKV